MSTRNSSSKKGSTMPATLFAMMFVLIISATLISLMALKMTISNSVQDSFELQAELDSIGMTFVDEGDYSQYTAVYTITEVEDTIVGTTTLTVSSADDTTVHLVVRIDTDGAVLLWHYGALQEGQ